LFSAGYDAHSLDPLGGMRLTTDGYKWLAHGLIKLADELCKGKIVFFLEGGYNLEALKEGVRVTLEELIVTRGS
jgi:acetoin utilization deacetylase AcuC-like enzyme